MGKGEVEAGVWNSKLTIHMLVVELSELVLATARLFEGAYHMNLP